MLFAAILPKDHMLCDWWMKRYGTMDRWTDDKEMLILMLEIRTSTSTKGITRRDTPVGRAGEEER